MKNQTQMELGLNGAQQFSPANHRASRISRAQWWFAQMRQVVDRAMDWEPNGPGKPEQTWFADANGQRN